MQQQVAKTQNSKNVRWKDKNNTRVENAGMCAKTIYVPQSAIWHKIVVHSWMLWKAISEGVAEKSMIRGPSYDRAL